MRDLPSLTQEDLEKVLCPIFAFDDVVGWSAATKQLCCNTAVGQIHEYSPLVYDNDLATTWYRHLHLPKIVIGKDI